MPKKKKKGLSQAEILAMQQSAPQNEQTAGPSGTSAPRRRQNRKTNPGNKKKEDDAKRNERLEKRRIYMKNRREYLRVNEKEKYERLLEAGRKNNARSRERAKGKPETRGIIKIKNTLYWKKLREDPKRHKVISENKRKYSANWHKKLREDEGAYNKYLESQRIRQRERRVQKKAVPSAALGAAIDLAPSPEQGGSINNAMPELMPVHCLLDEEKRKLSDQMEMPPLIPIDTLTDSQKKHLDKLAKERLQRSAAAEPVAGCSNMEKSGISAPDAEDYEQLMNRDPLRKKMSLQKAIGGNRSQKKTTTGAVASAACASTSRADDDNNYDLFASLGLTRKRPDNQTDKTGDTQPGTAYTQPKKTSQQRK